MSRSATRRAASPPRAPVATPPVRPAPAAPPRLDLWIGVALIVVTLALYWPVHGFDFVNFDDVDYVRANAPIRAGLTAASVRWAFTTLWGSFWIPLTWLSYMLDTQLYGTSAGGYHVTNVLLHATSTVLLYLLLQRATGQRWPSAFVAALFALHPLHVESVAWVTERKDTLSTVFLLLTLWRYGVYVARPTTGRYLGALAVFAMGLASKPMLTTMPALLLLLDLWPLRRFSGLPPMRLLLEKIPFLVLAVPSALVTMASGHHLVVSRAPLEGIDLLGRAASACEAYILYLVQTVWPAGLAVLYPEQPAPPLWRAGLAAAALTAAMVGALRAAPRRPWLTVGWLWYVIALLPVSGLVKIGHFTMADRFTYVPLIGIFVLVAWEASTWAPLERHQPVAWMCGLGALAGCVAVARIQLGYWQNDLTLCARTVAVTGPNPVTQYLWGLGLAERGRTDEAMAQYTEALRLRPDYAHVHTSLGLLLSERGQVDEAIVHFTAALRIDPAEAYAHTDLGNALLLQSRVDEAIAHYTEALRIDPDLARAHVNYGKALASEGRTDEAMAQYVTGLRLDPEDADAHDDLANLLAAQHRTAEALAHYTTALRLRPGHAVAHANLARLLAEQGRLPGAVEHFRAAVRLEPDDARFHADLGNVLAAQGDLAGATTEYGEALRLDPDDASVHSNLGNALVMLGRPDDGIAQYEAALRIAPQYAEAHFNLGMTLADHGRLDDAAPHFAAAVRAKPAYADAHTQLGLTLQAKGDTAGARAELREALQLNPTDAVAQQALAALDGAAR